MPHVRKGHHNLLPDGRDPRYFAAFWCDLGIKVGGLVNGGKFSPKECYVCAIQSNLRYSAAWYVLGILGGGLVN